MNILHKHVYVDAKLFGQGKFYGCIQILDSEIWRLATCGKLQLVFKLRGGGVFRENSYLPPAVRVRAITKKYFGKFLFRDELIFAVNN